MDFMIMSAIYDANISCVMLFVLILLHIIQTQFVLFSTAYT